MEMPTSTGHPGRTMQALNYSSLVRQRQTWMQ